jgi:hypothetical protein
MVKIIHFNYGRLTDMEEWVKEESIGRFKRVNFTSGCSTKIAFQFELPVDAVMFKLKWS